MYIMGEGEAAVCEQACVDYSHTPTHQMPNEYLRAALYGIVQRSVLRGVLDFGVDVHLHTHKEDDGLHVLLEDGQVQEVLALAVHLAGEGRESCR